MLAIIHIEFENNDLINNRLTKDQYTQLRDQVVGLRLSEWDDETNKPKSSWYGWGEDVCVDLTDDVRLLEKLGIKYSVQRVKNTYTHLAPAQDPGQTHVTYNFALPNIGLLVIDEVTWLDDACTEELQRHLNEKWRIIAVCPPNGARRPDYILGRTKTT
jgi:hypothetical protein